MAIPVRLMTCQPGTAGAVANTAFNTEVTKNTEAAEKNFWAFGPGFIPAAVEANP